MSRLQRVPDVVFQELDGEVLVLRPGAAEVLHLNRTASDVWHLLSTDSSPEEIAALLSQAYGVDAAQVGRDLEPVLDLLLGSGVLRQTGS